MSILNGLLPKFQIIIAVALITVILLQQRGQGLGSVFGGGGSSFHTKRGMEKILFTSTIALGIIFILTAIITLVAG